MKVRSLTAVAVLFIGINAMAQGTADDYRRAYELRDRYSMKNVWNAGVSPRWIDGTDKFHYAVDTPEGRRYKLVDAAKGKCDALFDHGRLAKAISDATENHVSGDSLQLGIVRVSAAADTIDFSMRGVRYRYFVKGNRVEELPPLPPRPDEPHWMVVDPETGGEAVVSPDGKHKAFIRDYNVWVSDADGRNARALSDDGSMGNYYSSRIFWSPDSRSVAVNRIRPAVKHYVYYVESSPADQLQPKLHKQEYAKPGDEVQFKRPAVFNVETGEKSIPDVALIDNQYELFDPVWEADSRAVTVEYNGRGHKVYRVLELAAVGGDMRPIVEETHDKYVNYVRNFRHDMSDGKHIIWSSERDGYQHLYMIDRTTAQPAWQITRGEWYVRGVQHVDEDGGRIYFSASGVRKDEDPYLIRYYSIKTDGTDMRDLTPAMGHHSVTYSPDMKYLVDVWSTVVDAPQAALRSAVDGRELMHLETADISRLTAAGWTAPEVFVAPGRDGKTPMWGLIRRPSNFDPSKKYPVIEYIYQGPGDQYVPKSFRPYDWWMTSLSELGFIVVMVDGMGTSFRSRDFENVCYKNLKDAAIPDHIAWLKAAGEKYPYMDLDRVGIYGCSAGGQESLSALLLYPEFYKACYSACGCHDNRMDKIWWNELWMGYPVDESYAQSSNVVNAHLLQHPLMLVVGEMDDNVDPASTMQVADALIRAGKDFELVVIPGAHHTMGEDFGERKRYDFFVRHLLGVTPPSWQEIPLP